MTKYLFLDSKEKGNSSTGGTVWLQQCLATFLTSLWKQELGQQMLYLCACALNNQPTVRTTERAHMCGWQTSCLCWVPFVWMTEICWNLPRATPVLGFSNYFPPKSFCTRAKRRAERREKQTWDSPVQVGTQGSNCTHLTNKQNIFHISGMWVRWWGLGWFD